MNKANHAALLGKIAWVRQMLERQIDRKASLPSEALEPIKFPEPSHPEAPSALENLSQAFGLSQFEQEVLLLCAGMELDGRWPVLCAAASEGEPQGYPSFSLAMAIFDAPQWLAFTPDAPLRRWHLIELGPGNAIITSPLRIDERILNYLLGIQQLDGRLQGLARAMPLPDPLVPSHQKIAEDLAQIWLQASERGQGVPVLQLWGSDGASKGSIASTVYKLFGAKAWSLSAEVLPTDSEALRRIQHLCEREWLLNHCAWLLDCDNLETLDPAKDAAVARFIEDLNCSLMVTSRDRRRLRQRPIITVEIVPPTLEEQRLLWYQGLGEAASHAHGPIDKLISHFSLSAPEIQAACLQSQATNPDNFAVLWTTCRSLAQPRMADLAQPIRLSAQWEDLVLPDREKRILRDITRTVRQRMKVYHEWGFAGQGGRGLGISALFSGASGTGKTMAAEVVAQELQLDIYRIDLSSVVSKYIGETEKNLRRVFDAAEGSGAILLFDEADALFGKRSEVKDSHDRHANIEVGYLLQRMEAYRGLAILTTNLKSSLDQAFLRRIRFVVQFPFPDSSQRSQIWQTVFPKKSPTQGLDFDKLAKLNVAGGNIRNIALNAAFLAADADEAIGMKHILQATRSEYTKLERTLTEAEVKGWC